MPETLVVFHSGYGHAQRLAQAVAAGAGAQLLAIDADGNLPEGSWERLAAADAIVFGSPTYMGGPGWQFKKFAYASSRPWFGQAWRDKLFAGFPNSGSINGALDARQGDLTWPSRCNSQDTRRTSAAASWCGGCCPMPASAASGLSSSSTTSGPPKNSPA